MSELLKSWRLEPLDLQDLPQVLKQCGKAVVKEITRCVLERVKPSGVPQKQNAPSTIAAKGHDHPVVEKRFRFAREATYGITPIDETSVKIAPLSPEDSEIAARLEERGYDFFGITDKAEEEAFAIMDEFLCKKVNEAFGGKR